MISGKKLFPFFLFSFFPFSLFPLRGLIPTVKRRGVDSSQFRAVDSEKKKSIFDYCAS